MAALKLKREKRKIHSYCFCFGVLEPAADCKMRTWLWSKRKLLVSSFQEDLLGVVFNE